MAETKKPITSKLAIFGTSGLGGVMGWCCVHPFNTLAVRANLQSMQTGKSIPLVTFASQMIKEKGFMTLYNGLGAGCVRQIFYATSRFGLFEVIRDKIAEHREVDFFTRLFAAVSAGGMAAIISCPSEVSLVRMSNDATLPLEKRRNYTSVLNAATRIVKEEGAGAFYRGSKPFVTRCMMVGACQVATYDQFKTFYAGFGIGPKNTLPNVFCAAMSAGLFYSIVTMPFESAKNRQAFQVPDPKTGELPYKGVFSTIAKVSRQEGFMTLYNGFPAYYGRCGGHTVTMFVFVEQLRDLYRLYGMD